MAEMERSGMTAAIGQGPAQGQPVDTDSDGDDAVINGESINNATEPYEFKPPYSDEMRSKMMKFYKGRKTAPYDFTYTQNGDLEVLEGAKMGKRGKPWPAMTLTLKAFVDITAEERQVLEDRREQEIAKIQEEYEKVSTELQMAWMNYRNSGAMREVLLANQKMREIDARLSAALFSERDIVSIKNPPTKQILFDQPYEERKLIEENYASLKGKLFRIAKYHFPQFVEFGKYIDTAEEKEEEEAVEEGGIAPSELEYRQKLTDGRIARIFYESSDNKNGFLSPFYPATFTYKGGEYFTAYQAYEVLRAEELQLPDQAAKLLGTRSTRMMRLQTMKTTQHPADARNLWLSILTALYQQSPPLQKQLLDTGTDTLVFADSRPGPSGIGVAEKDKSVLNPVKWKGENFVGLALETIRTRLREQTLEEAPREEEVTKKVISEEEQQKAKVGAIITARRRARGGAF